MTARTPPPLRTCINDLPDVTPPSPREGAPRPFPDLGDHRTFLDGGLLGTSNRDNSDEPKTDYGDELLLPLP